LHIFNLSREIAPLFLTFFITHEVDNHNNCRGFLEDSSFDGRVLQENSSTCVHIKPRGIEATCIDSDDRRWPRTSLCSQFE